MIITTGSLKFKKIKALKNSTLRPTSNKVRQAIFNILRHKLKMDEWKQTAFMLDAFAGTGVVSFEAISRGVCESTLIEKDFTSFKNLKDNAGFLKVSQKVKIINEDFFNIKSLPYKYKLIYLDPPYYKKLIFPSIEKIYDINILDGNSIIVCETEKNCEFPDKLKKYTLFTKAYSTVKLTFLKYI